MNGKHGKYTNYAHRFSINKNKFRKLIDKIVEIVSILKVLTDMTDFDNIEIRLKLLKRVVNF